MRMLSRNVVAVCAGAALLGAAGCGTGGETTNAPASTQQNIGLGQVDPCTVLTPEELSSLGFEGPGQKQEGISSEPGCAFDSLEFGITISKNEEKSVEEYGKQDSWAKFDQTQVDGRPAATGVSKNATQADVCTALVDAGGGVVLVDVSLLRAKEMDECGEALKIAEKIAPRLPK
ncbi:DUF3558 domain-containing protein [Saccharopolyspora hirsuta]|uniref:DUF3558 domain-containing protein n=2 Tax=Saccharopolyspora hirsuta TaxID=1837 RepID=A0A5M7BQ02_SACHI|nr:DUF3558 domain-containing protein [Saccharopolyspora hirsuta]